ncbi:ABC multidrug [Cordyceps militaris]|uniref:ABC multidrug n=1 Tax=Cordyceps militaris TaxID=73501 RepID=A0A2H4SM58_CORMI|nr:ABC multidrug [Cordyceps militaris]
MGGSEAPTLVSNGAAESRNHWHLKHKVVAAEARDRASGFPPRELGVTWTDLTVEAISSDAAIHENVGSQLNIVQKIRESRQKPPMKTILDKVHGCVKPGEMLLVLGRPGSGCTTLLNVLSNNRHGFANVTGDVHFGSLTADEAKRYRGQIIMNTEEEIFFPTLTVGQTMDFATRLNVPFTLPSDTSDADAYRLETRNFLLQSMGIEHTHETKVGNAFVRGVSGGERKRVSIIECLASKGSVFCWDNSTRGLDASSALDYVKAIRAMTDVLGLASIVTLYQAGNGIYNLFDKVLILDEGKETFYGTLSEARPFMEGLGFICEPGANVADYLTGVTIPTERKVRPEKRNTFPRTAASIRDAYEASPVHPRMAAEYDYPTTQQARDSTADFEKAVAIEKHKGIPAASPFTLSFPKQVRACVERQYQIIWGDKATFFIKQITNIIQALIAGSLFYNAPGNTGGLLSKSGTLFFSLLYPTLVAMSEVTDSFNGRPVLVKQKSFAFFHPAAFCLAQIAADIPVLLFQTSTFSLILYFMVDLDRTAGAFFTYWVIVLSAAFCMTAMFRAIGALFKTFDDASKVSGVVVTAAFLYAGFQLRKPEMHPWLVWVYWIDPLAYAFNALLSNEFHNKIVTCVGNNIIPSGADYINSTHSACAGIGGAKAGKSFILGDDYLASLSYSHAHLWRNFGIVWVWWAFFVAVTSPSENGPSLVIPRENSKRVILHPEPDEENQNAKEQPATTDVALSSTDGEGSDSLQAQLVRNTSIFTWKNLSYTVKTPSGDRLLLDNVQGWIKPGNLTALMGSSGAGKTTLLDVLAQRKTDGTITGSILVDGRPLPVSFQRSAGYCEQLDVHEPYATVREALEFSALLRQSRDTPRAEKLAYVETIIDLLELHPLADTLIGDVGAGLSVEQRKRVTIGVELVSKPSILIFLDEPTSGLDGQSAYRTVKFLRKLAAVGQAVLVTIHQPSAQLFSQFDSLLLLAKGGKTVYFGDIGENGQTIKDYFGRNGCPCPSDANPAEYMIDVVSGNSVDARDWNEIWMASPEHEKMTAQLDGIIKDSAAKPPGTVDDGHEFATPMGEQIRVVTQRMNISLWRNTEYVNNKVMLHVFSSLFNGFSFWMVGNSFNDLQAKMFAIFQFIFVAPGVLAQLQPLFISRRDIFETREKKSKTYSWFAFTTGLIVSEMPYLVLCGVIYYLCWYYTVGFPGASSRAGGTFFVMLMYEFLYTGIGQFVAAYAPNVVSATLVNPLIIGVLVSFCGVLVPYAQIQPFWRYWMYYLNPFNYLMGSILTFTMWGNEVQCKESEFARFDPPTGQTCGQYLDSYLHSQGPGSVANLVNADATSDCKVCTYTAAQDYLRTLNLNEYYYGWRDAGIVVLLVFSSYMLVYVLMKLRTKRSKQAE